MSKQTITPAMIELRNAITEAETLTANETLSKRDETRVNVLLAKISALRQNAVARNNAIKAFWRKLERGELRATDMLAGSQSITYTHGPVGGYAVPNEFIDDVLIGMAQVDPLLDEDVVTLITTKGGRPITLPGWDLSNVKAALVPEGTQQGPQTVPIVSGKIFGGYRYSFTLDASSELEDDIFESLMTRMEDCYAVAFARGIGSDLVTGTGSSEPQGILVGAVNSGVQLDPTITADVSATLNDQFQKAYFSVNRTHRASDKCAWAMSDQTYQWLRSLTDKQARPLINIKDDKETIMGKPVLICPTMPTYSGVSSPVVTGKIVFGDFSHYVVRVSELTMLRVVQAPGYVEFGKALYTAFIRADAKVFDPTNGSVPPLVYVNVHP